MLRLTAAAFLLAASQKGDPTIEEASGVCVRDGELLIVCNENDGRVFRIGVNDLRNRSIVNACVGGTFHHDGEDLESIDILADGRLVALSEDNHCLIDEHAVVATYGDATREHANRGLEGLSVRPTDDGRSQVAVLWEGGYPKRKNLKKKDAGDARRPFVWIHTLNANASGVLVGELDARVSVLDLPPQPGSEPDAMRWRAPDLVWHDDGFIVLLGQRTNNERSRRHGASVLQRYDDQGRRIGDPVTLPDIDADGQTTDLGPSADARTSWEGLAWLEPGRRLVLVNDAGESSQSYALVVDLPPSW